MTLDRMTTDCPTCKAPGGGHYFGCEGSRYTGPDRCRTCDGLGVIVTHQTAWIARAWRRRARTVTTRVETVCLGCVGSGRDASGRVSAPAGQAVGEVSEPGQPRRQPIRIR